jgi:hypothetical protein
MRRAFDLRCGLVGLAISGLACSSGATSGGGPADGGAADGPRADAGPPVARTSATCGAIPILGDFAGDRGPVPDACSACVATKCCSQASACAGDAACKAWKECEAATGRWSSQLTGLAPGCKPPTGSSAQLNGAFNSCRESCDACLDLSCAGKPWPTPAGSSWAMHITATSFTAGTPLPGVTVKVCAPTDAACATPLQTATTAMDGTFDATGPSGPGGPGYYLDFSGGAAAPTVVHHHTVDVVTLGPAVLSKMSFGYGLLDSNTWTLLRGSYNLPADPGTRSRLNAQVFSCAGTGVPGATVTSSSADSMAFFAYVANGVPSMTATQTDSSGFATWENHPAGPTTLTAMKGGQKLASVDVDVRAGVIVSVSMPPGQ